MSVEKFAAFLDGNLSVEETRDMSELIMHDSSLSKILNANIIIDDQILQMQEGGFELPEDLLTLEFDYPQLDDMADSFNVDNFISIIQHEEWSIGIDDGGALPSEEASLLHQDFVNFNENNNFEDISSNDNDSMNGSDSHLDFLNND